MTANRKLPESKEAKRGNGRSVVCELSVFSQFSPTNLWDTAGTVWGLPDSERECFRTINVQWIGQWGLFSRCSSSENQ